MNPDEASELHMLTYLGDLVGVAPDLGGFRRLNESLGLPCFANFPGCRCHSLAHVPGGIVVFRYGRDVKRRGRVHVEEIREGDPEDWI